jgi:hypothetical protein
MRIFVIGILASLLVTNSYGDAGNTTSPATPSPSSQITLSLPEYEALRDANRRPSTTVIDTIHLGGTFRGRDLTITFSGRSMGQRPRVDIVDGTNDVTMSGCSGGAIITRTSRGSFALIPLAETFEVKCDLRLSGSDRLAMHVLPAVLDVRASVTDGELIAGDEDDTGARNYSLVRQMATGGERLDATATGHYRITLLPDASRFHYTIDVRNPNRSTSTLTLSFLSNEHLQQIDSAAPYEADGNRYVFTIPPGDSAIQMSGELRGTTFRAPVDASLQYLVIESHPLIRASVQSQAKRVSIAETGITPMYRGALAFETGSQQIGWKTTRLEALRAISYAAKSAHHRIFLPIEGPVLGQTTFSIRNEGAPEIILPREPEPTFVSLQDEPVFMTRDASGHLTIPLSTGEQSVIVQHRQPFGRSLGFAAGEVKLPKLEVATSETSVSMTYPSEWIPLYQSFGSRSQIWTPDLSMVLVFLTLLLWIERLLAWLDVPTARRFTIAILASLGAAVVVAFLILSIATCIAATIAWLSTLSTRGRLKYGAALIALAFVVMAIAAITNVRSTGDYEMSSAPSRKMATDTAATDTAMSANDGSFGDQQSRQANAYQGLPAKFDLPDGARWTSFNQELLPVERPLTVAVLAVSIALVKWLGLALAIIAMILIGADRHRLAAELRSRISVEAEPPLADAS